MLNRKMWKVTASLLLCALFVPQGVQAEKEVIIPYTDIWSHWAKKSIFKGVEEGLFAESKDGRFYPDRLITRGEYLVLLDRLFLRNQQQLQPLTLLSESFLLGREDDFTDPSLPYTDVNRMSWMYRPILRSSLFLETLFGPDALHRIFPGDELHPGQPITRGEAAQLLQGFVGVNRDADAWTEITAKAWLSGQKTEPLSRAEAAVLAEQVISFIDADALLPTLDVDGTKYPLVPDIQELFPLFATYTEWKTADDDAYLTATEAIRNREDDEQTYEELKRLAQSDFPNKVGVYYYLSWNPYSPLEENLTHALSSIDSYFADKIVLPDTMRLLVANVYDIILQMEADDQEIYAKTLERLRKFESRMKAGTKEWNAFQIYLAAMEAKKGDIPRALATYRDSGVSSESLRNAVYYLLEQENLEQAEKLVKSTAADEQSAELMVLQQGILRDLSQLKEQDSIATQLMFVLGHFEQQQDYRVHGNATLSGFRFKYTQEIDRDSRTAYTTGYYQVPDKLVLQKLESYTDDSQNIEYIRDFDDQKWTMSRTDTTDFMYEWIEQQSIRTRMRELQARYELHSSGPYDIITEWISGEAILQKSRELRLESGHVRTVPLYINKYYIDRESDTLVAHQWRYEEIYDSKKYVSYSGNEQYHPNQNIKVYIPDSVRKGVDSTR